MLRPSECPGVGSLGETQTPQLYLGRDRPPNETPGDVPVKQTSCPGGVIVYHPRNQHYKGAIATGAFGVRWVSKENSDAFYGWLNAINEANFRHFDENGTPSGHDNFNYWVQTWEHRFNQGRRSTDRLHSCRPVAFVKGWHIGFSRNHPIHGGESCRPEKK